MKTHRLTISHETDWLIKISKCIKSKKNNETLKISKIVNDKMTLKTASMLSSQISYTTKILVQRRLLKALSEFQNDPPLS